MCRQNTIHDTYVTYKIDKNTTIYINKVGFNESLSTTQYLGIADMDYTYTYTTMVFLTMSVFLNTTNKFN